MEIKCYYGYPVNNFYDLRALAEIGVEYVRLAPPLSHMLPDVKKIGIPIRAVPNVAYQAYFPRADGVCGQWIRPEDVDAYAEYIDAMEFEDCDIKKEQALYRIYADQKRWPGELGEIITNLNALGVNRMINPEDSQRRISCGQSCQRTGICHLCYSILRLADPELLKPIAESRKERTE